MNPRRPDRYLPWGLVGTMGAGLVAVAAVFLVGAPRELALYQSAFHFNAAGGAKEITPGSPLEFGFPYGDFDLLADVEMSTDSELDLVFRRVEPLFDGQQFHGRFNVLRLSSAQRGPPYRTREEALFGAEEGGLNLLPGLPATIRIEARGTRARAYVAGTWLDWVETTDNHGSILLVARGGKSLLRKLDIQPLASGDRGLAWLLASVLVMAASSVLFVGGATPRRLFSLLVIPLGAWVSSRLVVAQMLPMTAPDVGAILLLALWLLPAALAVAGGKTRLALAGVIVGLVALEMGCRRVATRLTLFEDPRLSQYFGDHSGGAPLDALVRRLVSVTNVDTLRPAERRIFFMGGKDQYEPLFRRDMFPARGEVDDRRILALLTSNFLQQSLGEEVVGSVVPTLAAHAQQQLLLLRTFYLDFAPRVVVFAVTDVELEPGVVVNTSEQMLGKGPALGLVLAELLTPGGDDTASTPEDLRQTLEELAALCRDRSIALVFLAEADLSGVLLEVIRSVVNDSEADLCILKPWEEGKVRARQLGEAILPHLR